MVRRVTIRGGGAGTLAHCLEDENFAAVDERDHVMPENGSAASRKQVIEQDLRYFARLSSMTSPCHLYRTRRADHRARCRRELVPKRSAIQLDGLALLTGKAVRGHDGRRPLPVYVFEIVRARMTAPRPVR